MTAKQVIRRLRAEGWVEVRQTGSHRQLKHPVRPERITVPMHGSKDLADGTLANIKRKAGW
jgi:predicted RNA binding protein YcfA (HicA-like mRNA interferase family)